MESFSDDSLRSNSSQSCTLQILVVPRKQIISLLSSNTDPLEQSFPFELIQMDHQSHLDSSHSVDRIGIGSCVPPL